MEEKPSTTGAKDPNALLLDDGKMYKIQKVRQRKIHSCVPCHQRKVKCSREHPVCHNCVKNNLDCKYFVNDRVSRGKKNKDVDKETDMQRKQELKEYMEKAKSLCGTGASISPPPMNVNGGSPPSGTKIKSSKKSKESNGKKQFESIISPVSEVENHPIKEKSLTFSDSESSASNESLSPPKFHNAQVLPTDKLMQSNFNSTSDINNSNNSTASLFDATSQQTRNNSLLVGIQSRSTPPISTYPSRTIYNDYSLPSATTTLPLPANPLTMTIPQILLPKQPDNIPVPKLEEIFSALPTKERSYGLVKRYIKVIHPILPILDINEFSEQHDLFWNNKIQNKLEFVSLLLTVLYAASKAECFEFSYDEITKFELSNEIHRYLRVARVALTAINYPQVYSLRVLQSAVILQSTLENPSLIDVSILVRIAHMIKLHRDPATYHNISDTSLVQLRRLLWWQIFYLDAMTSLKQMSQPIIRLDEFDTSLPVEYVNGSLYYEMCFLNGKFRFTLILNELTRFIYGIAILPYNTIQILKQKILDLQISCNASIMNLENFERSKNLTYEESTFVSWSKSVLGTYCDRALLLLQKKIILANVLNTNEDGNVQIFHNSYNQMMNNKKSQFSIDSIFNADSTYLADIQSNASYAYDDLSNNLLPASLHYLYEFLKNNNDDVYNGFNWEIRNTLPFDAIVLVLTNLIQDLKKNHHNNKDYELRNDVRYHILDKSLDLIFIKFDNKKRSIIKNCFTLIRYLFQILRLKYLRNDGSHGNLIEFDNFYTDQIIPKPINGSPANLLKREHNKGIPNFNSNNFGLVQTTSCSQIAPRTMRALAGSNGSISFSNPPINPSTLNSVSVSDMFVNGLTSDVNVYGSASTGSNGMANNSLNEASVDEGYKEHELQRIKSQITKFLREERLNDDDPFNNKFYINIEREVRDLIERLI